MYVSQMFKSKKTEMEDVLYALGEGWIHVTILGVDFKVFFDSETREEKPEYLLKLREFHKPVKLRANAARAIAQLLNTENTDDWIGKCIRIRAVKAFYGNTPWFGFDVDLVLPTGPSTLPANMDVSGSAAECKVKKLPPGGSPPKGLVGATGAALPAAAMGSIGVDKALLLYSELDQRGKNFDDLRAWLKAAGMNHLVDGVAPPEYKLPVLQACKPFLAGIPKTRDKPSDSTLAVLRAGWVPPEQPEVINTKTGEVIKPGGVNAGTLPQIPEDDIPF